MSEKKLSENEKNEEFSPRRVYYVVMISNLIVAILVIQLWVSSALDSSKRRFSILPDMVKVMMDESVKMRMKIDTLEEKIDNLKYELDVMKQKQYFAEPQS